MEWQIGDRYFKGAYWIRQWSLLIQIVIEESDVRSIYWYNAEGADLILHRLPGYEISTGDTKLSEIVDADISTKLYVSAVTKKQKPGPFTANGFCKCLQPSVFFKDFPQPLREW